MGPPEVIDLTRDVLDPSAVGIVDASIWRRLKAIGVTRSGSLLVVAMSDPNDKNAVQELRIRTGLNIFTAGADEEEIFAAIDRSCE